MNFELAEAYRLIEPTELGRRLHDARILAGRTQADMAGEEVTAAYISRIEAGQRKPEFHLLGRMAARVGTDLDRLLAPPSDDHLQQLRVALDYAELGLASGDAEAALKGAEGVLSKVADSSGGDELERAARRVRAFALEGTGDLAGAIVALEDLTREPERSADWLRCLIALSRCYRESGELDRAISTGEQAQTAIVELGLEGLTEAIQLTLTVASAYVVQGDLEHASRLCLRAADAADKYGSMLGRGSAYWNASIVETKRGSHTAALELARKALAYFEVGEDLRNLGRLRTQIALTQLRIDPPDPTGALETLDKADQEYAWSAVSTLDLAHKALIRARANFLLGNLSEAVGALELCDSTAPDDAVVLRASSLALAGQIAGATGDAKLARERTLEAVRTLTGIGADRDAAQLWFELGTMLEASGDTASALDAFRRAASSTGLHTRPTVVQAAQVLR